MFTANFNGCCGIRIAYGFFESPYQRLSQPYSTALKKGLQERRKVYRGEAFLVVLNENQRKQLEQTFLDEGFSLITNFKSGTTGNQLYLYLQQGAPYR